MTKIGSSKMFSKIPFRSSLLLSPNMDTSSTARPATTEEQPKPNFLKKILIEKKSVLQKILRFFFSHIGLCILNTTYFTLGTFMFMALEGYQDTKADADQMKQVNVSLEVDQTREKLIDRIISNAISSNNYSENTIAVWLYNYHLFVNSSAVNDGYQGSITAANITASNRWSFSSVMLFVLTINSSIGYGHITPQSDLGYLAVVLYGLFGIPFFVMSLGSIGSGLAATLKAGYHRVCCWGINRKRRKYREELPKAIDGVQEQKVEEPVDDYLPLTLPLTTVVLYLFFGQLLFSYRENWTGIQSIYFCVVTLMTIGFGDFVPGWSETSNVTGDLSMAFALLYIVIGLALVSMTLNVAVDLLRYRVTVAIIRARIWQEEDRF